MVRDKRATSDPIGLGLVGEWVELEPSTTENEATFRALDERRSRHPAMGAWRGMPNSEIAPSMLVRDRRTGQVAGLLENHSAPGAVTAISIYFDRSVGRPGAGMEAVAMYISHLFDSGARLVVAEVLAFNSPMIAIFRKHGIEPQARLREHVFIGGHFWDLLVYAFDREEWVTRFVDRHRQVLPGGRRRPAAIGVRPRSDAGPKPPEG